MKTFIVLGMHRSATSLVSKGLVESGVDMGVEDALINEGNPEGHWENLVAVQFNDMLLNAAGGSWDYPPPEEDILLLKNKDWVVQGVKDFIQRFGEGRELWGWKDPRTCLTIRLYHDHLTNPHYITCFRDPADVALSLQMRDGTPLHDGLKLAEEYNRRLKAFINDYA